MHVGRTVFAQLMDFLPRHEFNTTYTGRRPTP